VLRDTRPPATYFPDIGAAHKRAAPPVGSGGTAGRPARRRRPSPGARSSNQKAEARASAFFRSP